MAKGMVRASQADVRKSDNGMRPYDFPVVTPVEQAERNQRRLEVLNDEKGALAKRGKSDAKLNADIRDEEKRSKSGDPFKRTTQRVSNI